MKYLSRFYERLLNWSRHRSAPMFLAGISFIESSFFPIPPDVMMVPMILAKPKMVWRYVGITTVFSVLGGVLGYCIGLFAFNFIEPYIISFGYQASFAKVVQWFHHWGVWIIFLAGVTPVPYKLFTIASGVVAMPFWPFFIVSWFGRGLRFLLVGVLTVWGGERIGRLIHKYTNRSVT